MRKNHSDGRITIYISALLVIYLMVNPFKNRGVPTDEKLSNSQEPLMNSRPEYNKKWLEYEWLITHDPATGLVPLNARNNDRLAVMQIPQVVRHYRSQTFVSAGPMNFSGRARACAYDLGYNGSSNRMIIAGSVSGGLFRSMDGGQPWSWIPTPNLNNITTLAQDPRMGNSAITGNPYRDTWFAGTGEYIGNSASSYGHSHHGYGLMVSDDKGLTWQNVTITQTGKEFLFDNRFDFIDKVMVNLADGAIWISYWGGFVQLNRTGKTVFAVNQTFELGANIQFGTAMNDFTMTQDGSKIFLAWNGLGTSFHANYPASNFQGLWEGKNATKITWKKIVDSTLFNLWPGPKQYERIVIALAPSNESILYALMSNQLNATTKIFPTADLFKLDMTMPASYKLTDLSINLPSGAANENFRAFDSQGGYNLAIAVKPDNPNFVLIGGSSAYRSTNGFNSKATTSLIGGFNYLNTPPQRTQGYDGDRSHPDIHGFVFRPGSSSEMIHFHDGGVSLTTNIAEDIVKHQYLNSGMQTIQYYTITVDPNPGPLAFIGGTQDNGAIFYNGMVANPQNQSLVVYGDGMSQGISRTTNNNKWFLVSTQNGNFYRRTVNPANNAHISWSTSLMPTGSTSAFKTNFLVDPDNTEDVYYAGQNVLYRTTMASSVTSSNWQMLSGTKVSDGEIITSLATTRGPYNNLHNLFFGTSLSKLFRLQNPRSSGVMTIPVNITPAESGVAAKGAIVDIALNSRNDDTMLVVYSNYNVKSIWWTGNAKSPTPTWTNVEGNLSEPSIRSGEIVVKKSGIEYFVGTTVGLYSTTSLNKANTVWMKEIKNSPMEFAVVNSIDHRLSDNTMVVGTHGNGAYFANIGDAVSTSLQELILKNFELFPVPSTSHITFKFDRDISQKFTFRITDLSGKILIDNTVPNGMSNGHTISLQQWPAGSYYLSIFNDNKIKTSKFVKI
ncbi:MAG: T9SS type A sorting domain-containing protein [Saprospiraceae bacterium]|nr:T9SS type A sorting domain-containing protein [Saprospiraceae bacterium]